MQKLITPYDSSSNKKKQVQKMFNNIAKSYDFLNHFLSLGIDIYWRKRVIKSILSVNKNPNRILDVATGTGDIAIIAARYTKAKIIGIDISKNMLELAKKKIEKHQLTNQINIQLADSEKLPFNNESYDAITVGFGVRNFEDRKQGIHEIYRTLKKDGVLVILEPCIPIFFPFKQLYYVYLYYILPFIGKIISKDSYAYSYLTESIDKFPARDVFCLELKEIGFKDCKYNILTFGTGILYIAIK